MNWKKTIYFGLLFMALVVILYIGPRLVFQIIDCYTIENEVKNEFVDKSIDKIPNELLKSRTY